jgi:hypothetical protein
MSSLPKLSIEILWPFLDNFDSFDSFDEVASVSSFFSSLEINRIDSKIWKWFAVIALICLVLEILIQKFIK